MVDSIDLIIRTSSRAHTISLRPKFENHQIILTLPSLRFEKQGLAFYETKKDWIQKQFDKYKKVEKLTLQPESFIEICGTRYLLKSAEKGGVFQEKDILFISGDESFFASRVRRFAKKMFQKKASEKLKDYALKVGRKIKNVQVKKMNSRWGSCGTDGKIALAEQLAFAPSDVANYVMAHEVAHLIEMNHSKAFWKIVEMIFEGNITQAKAWLRVHGKKIT